VVPRVEDLGVDNVAVVDGGFLSYVHEGEPADVVSRATRFI